MLQHETQTTGATPIAATTAAAPHLRQLTAWTPDTCYEACRQRLGNPPTFVINIYFDETLGEQVCTCCRTCQGWRYVPGAQIFAACTVGDGTNSQVRFRSRVSHRIVGAKPGKVIAYMARTRNLDKSEAVGGLAVRVQLPPGVTYLKSEASHGFEAASKSNNGGGGSKVHYRASKAPVQATVNASTRTVMWSSLLFPPRRGIKFAVVVLVDRDVDTGARLVFTASVYQQLPVNGLPYCASTGYNETVVVK